MNKKLGFLSILVLIISLSSCLTFQGNPDLKVKDKTVFEKEPYWLYGVKREVRSNVNYVQNNIFLVYTGGTNGNATATERSIGFARFKTAIDKYKDQPNFVIMDLGNLTNGSRSLLASRGQDAVDIVKDNIDYDFILPGVLDISLGDSTLKANAEALNKPDGSSRYSAFNLLDEDGRNSLFARYQLYDFSGYKLAIVGYVSPSAARVKSNLTVDTDINQFLAFLKLLRRQGVDGIVVTSFIPRGDEGFYVKEGGFVDRIASEVDDIILVSEGTRQNTSYEKDGTAVSIMKSGFDSFGVTTIKVKGAVKDKITSNFISASDISVTSPRYLKVDPEVSAIIEQQKASFREKYANIVAILPQKYKTSRESLREGNISDGKLSSLLLGTMKSVTKADVSMFPANYLASEGLDMGVVTPEVVDGLFSDASVLRVVTISPQDLYAMLENNARYIYEGRDNFINTNARIAYDWKKTAISFELPNEFGGDTSYQDTESMILAIYINNEPIDRNDTTPSIKVAFPSSMNADSEYARYLNKRGINYNPLSSYVKQVLRDIYPPF